MSSPASDDRHRVTLRCETGPRWLPSRSRTSTRCSWITPTARRGGGGRPVAAQAYPEVRTRRTWPGSHARRAGISRVLQLLEKRGLALGRDPGDPYAQALQALVRTPAAQRQLDRLLVAAIIEARSCERLALLAGALPDADLRRFYGELARSEDGHQKLFLRLAARVHGQETWPRLERLLDAEAELIRRLPIRAAIH